ncbi:MAG TPA: hypothetical protein VFW34_07910 [Candidatus Rubrimentiphilum sp.]|nr:hypothetical protein [Candidatus Rubrimentiphilum sp.]
MAQHRSAREIIDQVLGEVGGQNLDLLREIVEIEEIHLSDKGTVAAPLVAAAIERAAKLQAENTKESP